VIGNDGLLIYKVFGRDVPDWFAGFLASVYGDFVRFGIRITSGSVFNSLLRLDKQFRRWLSQEDWCADGVGYCDRWRNFGPRSYSLAGFGHELLRAVEDLKLGEVLVVGAPPRAGKSLATTVSIVYNILVRGWGGVTVVVVPTKRLAWQWVQYLLYGVYFLKEKYRLKWFDILGTIRIILYLGGVDSCLVNKVKHYYLRDCVRCEYFDNIAKIPRKVLFVYMGLLKLFGVCPFRSFFQMGFGSGDVIIVTHSMLRPVLTLLKRRGIRTVTLVIDEYIDYAYRNRFFAPSPELVESKMVRCKIVDNNDRRVFSEYFAKYRKLYRELVSVINGRLKYYKRMGRLGAYVVAVHGVPVGVNDIVDLYGELCDFAKMLKRVLTKYCVDIADLFSNVCNPPYACGKGLRFARFYLVPGGIEGGFSLPKLPGGIDYRIILLSIRVLKDNIVFYDRNLRDLSTGYIVPVPCSDNIKNIKVLDAIVKIAVNYHNYGGWSSFARRRGIEFVVERLVKSINRNKNDSIVIIASKKTIRLLKAMLDRNDAIISIDDGDYLEAFIGRRKVVVIAPHGRLARGIDLPVDGGAKVIVVDGIRRPVVRVYGVDDVFSDYRDYCGTVIINPGERHPWLDVGRVVVKGGCNSDVVRVGAYRWIDYLYDLHVFEQSIGRLLRKGFRDLYYPGNYEEFVWDSVYLVDARSGLFSKVIDVNAGDYVYAKIIGYKDGDFRVKYTSIAKIVEGNDFDKAVVISTVVKKLSNEKNNLILYASRLYARKIRKIRREKRKISLDDEKRVTKEVEAEVNSEIKRRVLEALKVDGGWDRGKYYARYYYLLERRYRRLRKLLREGRLGVELRKVLADIEMGFIYALRNDLEIPDGLKRLYKAWLEGGMRGVEYIIYMLVSLFTYVKRGR